MSAPAAALTLGVLVVVVAVGAATFFRRKLAAMCALLALPIALVLHFTAGGVYALLLLALAGILVALLHTISDTVGLLRGMDPDPPAPRYMSAEQRSRARRAERSRIAA